MGYHQLQTACTNKWNKATSRYEKVIVPFVFDLNLFLMSCGNTSGEATMSFESLSPLLLSGIDLTLVQLISVRKLAERTY